MSEAAAPAPPGLSRLGAGVVLTLVALAIAGLAGVIAVASADSDGGGFGKGIGVAVTVFLVGGTLATALACLRRREAEIAAIVGVVVAGLTIDLTAIAVWLEIDDETYLKVLGIALVWTLFALVILGLALASGTSGETSRPLFLVTSACAVLAGLVASWLTATAGAQDPLDALPSSALAPSTGSSTIVTYGSSGPSFTGEWLLRVEGVLLVVVAALWFATLAVSRLERSRP
jgi:hypothetical protein